MTKAICPACRSPIALGAALCGRCGLAVRPTCANCGEALSAGDRECARCRQPIETQRAEPAVATPATSAPRAVALAPRVRLDDDMVTAQLPAVALGTREYRRRGAVFGQLLVVAVVGGVIVAGGLLALEAFAPRRAPSVDLVHRSFPALGFSVSRPANWTESSPRDGTAIVFTAPAPDTRQFRVAVEAATLNHARLVIMADMSHPAVGRKPIGVSDPISVGGKPALRYAFTESGRFVQQWWVERPGGTFRIEFVSARSVQRQAEPLAERIVDTFLLG